MNPYLAPSDEQLFLQLKKGNHLAFQTIYNKYWLKLFGNAYNVLQDRSLAEDVLHEVFTNIWLRREELEIRNLGSYLFKAVRNNSLLQLKRDNLESIENVPTDYLTSRPDVELMLNQQELKLVIEKAIDGLPSRCQEIFYMSRYQDYSITEIAKHYAISNRTVENQIYKALKHLRVVLKGIATLLICLNLLATLL